MLALGVWLALVTIAALGTYTFLQVRKLRDEQTAISERNRKDSLQLLRIQNDLASVGVLMRDMAEGVEPYPLQGWRPALIATKGLLANHYLDASLGLTMLFPVRSTESPAVTVVYVNRSRADALGGFFGGLTRGIVNSRQRDGTVNELRALKARLETRWRESPESRR